jgi:hypothetical protein
MVVKSIAQFSNAKKFYVPSELLQTLLSLNIRVIYLFIIFLMILLRKSRKQNQKTVIR